MLSINTNISSLTAQDNLSGSSSALQQAITRLSSGKRLNSAADDPAGLAISTTLQTSINGLNQGSSNANDAVSMIQTASTALSQITSSLQTIRSLANESAGGTLSSANQASLQKEVTQQIAEVNRLASQTTYNGMNLLNGSAGVVNVQVGTQVGQTVSLDMSQSLSAGNLGGGYVQAGNTLGTLSGLDLTSTGTVNTSSNAAAITQVNVVSNGSGGFIFTDQNNQVISATASGNLFSQTSVNGVQQLSVNSAGGLTQTNELSGLTAAIGASTANTLNGSVLGVISGVNLDPTSGKDETVPNTANTITSVTVESNGKGGLLYLDQNGNQLQQSAVTGLFTVTGAGAGTSVTFANAPTSTFDFGAAGDAAPPAAPSTVPNAAGITSALGSINVGNTPTNVASVDVSTTSGANLAMEVVDNALATINNMQASLGAAQNRFTSVATAQQAEATDDSNSQSQILDANVAQESANMSLAQTQQQAGIAVLAQANSLPQAFLKLLG
jgi:flagellin